MPIRSIKAAARQSIRNANVSITRLTLLFALCLHVPVLLYNVLDGVMYFTMDTPSTGIGGFNSYAAYLSASTVLSLVISFFCNVWSCNYQNLTLNLMRGKEVSFRDLTAPFRIVFRVFWLYFLIGIYTALWSMLFCFPVMTLISYVSPELIIDMANGQVPDSPLIYLVLIPGLIIAYRYRLAYLVLFDNETLTASQALSESKRLTRGHKLSLFRLDLSFCWYLLPMAALTYVPGMVLTKLPEIELVPYLVILVVPVLLEMLLITLFLPRVKTADAHAYEYILHNQKPIEPIYADPGFPTLRSVQQEAPPDGSAFPAWPGAETDDDEVPEEPISDDPESADDEKDSAPPLSGTGI